MKPWYKSKKIWVAVLTALVTLAGPALELSADTQIQLVALGISLLAAIMGTDWGKEAKAIEAKSNQAMSDTAIKAALEEASK